jgi:two-component system sensor histidine kinase/response regulator
VIDNILDFSKMEAGQFRLDSYDFRFHKLEESLHSMFQGLILEHQLQLVVAFDPTIPEVVKGDLQRLNQVLYNLVGNAIKFTKQGEVRVNARLLSDGENEMVIHFEVIDTGIGIPPDQLPRIFKLFEQFDNSITREYGGTGLGLPIAMELVELMGGEMGVHSEYGKGTQFWFTSTLRKGDPAMLAAVDNESDLPNSLLGMKILLAEDNPFNQQVATDLLEQEGAEVHLARNGSEAVDLASRFRFDCILMDMQMPVMGGIEASRTIRSRPALAQVPIIAMTANASLDDRNQCLEAGMNDFITKPVRPALLFSAILRQIHRSSGATEEPTPLPETPTAEGASNPRPGLPARDGWQ